MFFAVECVSVYMYVACLLHEEFKWVPFIRVGFDVIYQTRESVFHYFFKHRDNAYSVVFLTKIEVFGNEMKHCLD